MITKKAHISLTNRYDERVDFSIEAYSSYVNLRAMTVCYLIIMTNHRWS